MVYVHSFRTTIHSSDGCFQQKKAPCNKHKSNWLLEHVSECTVTRSQSNRAPFGIWWSWRVTSRICSKKCTRFDTKKIQKETCPLLLLNIVKLKTKEKLLKETTGSFFFHVLWMFKPSSFPWQLTSRNLTFLDCFPQDLTHSDPDINALRKHYVYGKDTTCKLKQQADGLLLKNQSYQGCFDTFLR